MKIRFYFISTSGINKRRESNKTSGCSTCIPFGLARLHCIVDDNNGKVFWMRMQNIHGWLLSIRIAIFVCQTDDYICVHVKHRTNQKKKIAAKGWGINRNILAAAVWIASKLHRKSLMRTCFTVHSISIRVASDGDWRTGGWRRRCWWLLWFHIPFAICIKLCGVLVVVHLLILSPNWMNSTRAHTNLLCTCVQQPPSPQSNSLSRSTLHESRVRIFFYLNYLRCCRLLLFVRNSKC